MKLNRQNPFCYHSKHIPNGYLGLCSLSGRSSYRKISRSLEATIVWFRLFQSLWNLTGTSTAALPICLSNFRAIRALYHPISRLRDFTRFNGKTSPRILFQWSTKWCISFERRLTRPCSCSWYKNTSHLGLQSAHRSEIWTATYPSRDQGRIQHHEN